MAYRPEPLRKRDRLKARVSSLLQKPFIGRSTSPVPTAQNDQFSPPTPMRKAFTKSEDFRKDTAILYTAYVLQESPDELKKLIHEIFAIHDKDKEHKLSDVLETCVRVSVQLLASLDTDRGEAIKSIEAFTMIVKQINPVGIDDKSLSELTIKVKTGIDKMKIDLKLNDDVAILKGLNLSKVLDIILKPSISVLSLLKEASSLAPVPWLQPVIGQVVSLLQDVSQTRSNYNEMNRIAATAGEFIISCAIIYNSPKNTEEYRSKLELAMNKFTGTLEIIAQKCNRLSQQNPLLRFSQQNAHKETLLEIEKGLTTAINLFQNETLVHINLNMEALNRKFDFSSINSLPSHPDYMHGEYLAESREDVLDVVSHWLDNAMETFLWIHGVAGVGKSMVAQQLALRLRLSGRLAGGVFLSHLTAESSSRVLQMIAKELGHMHPQTIATIADAARTRNSPHHTLAEYLRAYIFEPIRNLNHPPWLVVIIDGLDEWINGEQFLRELLHTLPRPCPFKVILTSRLIESIERLLDQTHIPNETIKNPDKNQKIPIYKYNLPKTSQAVVEKYFLYHFKADNVNWRGKDPKEWEIRNLAQQADGLLIWAAQVRSLVSDKFNTRYPHEVLTQILSSEEKVVGEKGGQLERLYNNFISNLFPLKIRGILREFLGATLVFQDSLPMGDVADLLGIHARHVEEIHERLAVLQMQGDSKRDVISPAAQRYHASFLDFLQSAASASDDQTFQAISAVESHAILAKKCMKIVSALILEQTRPDSKLPDLPPYRQYAIRYWPAHLSDGYNRSPSADPDGLDISSMDLHGWATLFLRLVAPTVSHASLDDIPHWELPYKVAMAIEHEDVPTTLYQIHCLEIGVRLQPNHIETWTALGDAYTTSFEHGGNIDNMDKGIAAFRQALKQLVIQVSEKSDETTDTDECKDTRNLPTEEINPSAKYDRRPMLTKLGDGLLARFQQHDKKEDLDESILFYRQVLKLCPPGHPDRLAKLHDLGFALKARFDKLGESTDIEESISLHREALSVWPPPHPDRVDSLNNLAMALKARFDKLGDATYIKEAISLYREALELSPPPDPDRDDSLNNLADALEARFDKLGEASDIEEAISLHREALELFPPPHPDHYYSLNNLANKLGARFNKLGEAIDIEEAISLHREALELCPPPYPDRHHSLNNLANTLKARFDKLGEATDIEEAISLHREALELRPPPHPDRHYSLDNLGNALKARFDKLGETTDIEEAISLHREALELRPPPHSDRHYSLNSLANALKARFDKLGEATDIEEVISLHREALELFPPPHPDRHYSLDNLGNALKARFDKLGETTDIEEAISLHREALELRPPPHSDRHYSLNSLANALKARFDKLGEATDIEEVTSLRREALELFPPPHPDRHYSLDNLGNALKARFDKLGETTDIEEAISLHREAVALFPPPHPYRHYSLSFLANALKVRFDKLGEATDIEELISLHREALELFPPPHSDRDDSLNNLADALEARFDKLGETTDIEEAISLRREALELRPPPHSDHHYSLYILANALEARFDKLGEATDIEESISLHREALELRPPPHPDRHYSLNILANALKVRFDKLGEAADIEELISLRREALELRSSPHLDRHNSLDDLAIALGVRFDKLGEAADIEEAISLCREALELCPLPHPDRDRLLNNLAWDLYRRFLVHGKASDLDEAILLYHQARELCLPSDPFRSEMLNNLALVLEARYNRHHDKSDLNESIALRQEMVELGRISNS